MKPKKLTKRLLLRKQTVAHLNQQRMKLVLGGITGRTACFPTCDTLPFGDTGCCALLATHTCPEIATCQETCEPCVPESFPPCAPETELSQCVCVV